MSYLTEKSIGELLEYNFFIPSYQRGYRWTERQIEDLLEDINSFIPSSIQNTEKKTWYCLQPVVVKLCDDDTKKKNNLQGTWYEVIDGQQRLTSIFLIIHYANEMTLVKSKTPEFKIKYETRDESTKFLENQRIDKTTDEAIINYDNIDFYHITKAYNKIHDWVKRNKTSIQKEFNNECDFQSKFKSNSKVIWYEVSSEKDAIEIFTRINMGKIQLTDAELIKALFLNSSNFQDTEGVWLRQLEIASEWDRIEYALQNEELWYFIANSKSDYPARIEYIFNIMKNIDGKKNDKDQYSTFRFFSEKFKLKINSEIDENWSEIKVIFQTIEEWFSDRELYHKIGFLISTDIKIEELIIESKGKKKHEFRIFLDAKIEDKVKCDNLSELVYGKNSILIKNILLYHNIRTMLNNKDESSRFPFHRYKKEDWDLEHIHAIATGMPKNKEHRIDWLNNSKEFIEDDSDLVNSILDFVENYDEHIKSNPERFQEISSNVLKYYARKSNCDDDINNITNLVLLDSGTNRSYKNAVFPAKRKTIIAKEIQGKFIPICTKNVFLKYYSEKIDNMTFWSEKDRTAYFENINATVFNQ